MSIKFGLFSIKPNMGCTAIAVHIANYIANSEQTVAVIEAESVFEEELKTAKASFDSDGTFMLNNVHYYPAHLNIEPTEDVLIYLFRNINILQEFDDDFTRLFLCSDSDIESIYDINDYLLSAHAKNAELILFGATKSQLSAFLNAGYKCITIGDKKEPNISYNLAMNIDIALRQSGVIPPEYIKGRTYDELILHWEPDKNELKQIEREKAKNQKKIDTWQKKIDQRQKAISSKTSKLEADHLKHLNNPKKEEEYKKNQLELGIENKQLAIEQKKLNLEQLKLNLGQEIYVPYV